MSGGDASAQEVILDKTSDARLGKNGQVGMLPSAGGEESTTNNFILERVSEL
ncbi:hypothetical protein [Mesotoga sp.]|uniref:hypothetical protein n=1 Tax=Mesotoga sp. TaxID=2053577 RepID=UPI001BD53B0A|nr:hypothetical protein [Mesotoga sp.]MDD3460344.1 hypothetical protein [Mesotoga sp.]